MPEIDAGVTREDVLWCFTHLLGRNLNDEEAIGHFLRTERSFDSLVRTIAYSAEFRNNQAAAKRPGTDRDGFTYDESISTQEQVLKVLRLMRPKAVDGFAKRRVGAAGDGGYVMLDDFSDIEAAYSLGINNDVTWDKDIASRGIDIYQYDHTISFLPEEHERFHWFKKGIAGKKEGDLDTLPNLMKENGHERSQNLLLKCDIEGFEWDMLSEMTSSQLAQFRQIVLETHGWSHMNLVDFAAKIEKSVANLMAKHSIIHVHANNCASYAIVGGIPLPAVMEITLVRSENYRLSDSNELFPTHLDAPCELTRADFHLGGFQF